MAYQDATSSDPLQAEKVQSVREAYCRQLTVTGHATQSKLHHGGWEFDLIKASSQRVSGQLAIQCPNSPSLNSLKGPNPQEDSTYTFLTNTRINIGVYTRCVYSLPESALYSAMTKLFLLCDLYSSTSARSSPFGYVRAVSSALTAFTILYMIGTPQRLTQHT